jgi:3-oxoacyl-[acyl-carrier-protein] synthase II
LTVSAACSSGLHALIRATMLLQGGQARRAIVIAVESSVHPLFIASFKRLGVVPRAGVGCRPFDRQREGFLISEAAAAVCLEARSIAASRAGGDSEAEPIYIERFRLAGDAAHLTGSDPAGRALRYCMGGVVDGRGVDLVHAHGTGTELNDPIELAAIEACLGDQGAPPHIYSHKGALGHSLGAAGLVSVVLNCLSHRESVIPPNVQTREALPIRCAVIAPGSAERAVRRSVVAAAGFGGAVAAMSLMSPPYVR